jgi:hypothetical protein
MKSMRMLWACALVCFILAVGAGNLFGSSGTVIAKGDGIVLTEKDVAELKEYFAKRQVHSTPEQYRRVALRYELFAAEARKIGLHTKLKDGANATGDSSSQISLERKKKLADVYTYHLMRQQELPENVIESYYYAHPEKFRTDSNGTSLKPLDEKLKSSIKMNIVTRKHNSIVKAAFEKLKKKYKVTTKN